MAHNKEQNREGGLLNYLGDVSKNIVEHHHRENLSEFLLHDVCSHDMFGIRKAAYLVNNPDFSCLKGIAGYYNPEYFDKGKTWHNPKDFTSHMQKSQFNGHVRSYLDDAYVTNSQHDMSSDKIQELVEYLQIDDPAYHLWQLKHNNQGLFIFEKPEDHAILEDHLLKFLQMLSFCPVF
tara:strand:- start:1161 stop:1694 length:534 start_codon:yes stop_codon:yes gene_type:complete